MDGLKSAFRSRAVPEDKPVHAPAAGAPAASTSTGGMLSADAEDEDEAAAQCDWPQQAALLFRRSWYSLGCYNPSCLGFSHAAGCDWTAVCAIPSD